jgi:hypothetical protein
MVFIATIEIDETNFLWLDSLRRRHFPVERNFLSAHLTMFHHLSDAQMIRFHTAPLPTEPLPVSFAAVRFLGRGVAVELRRHSFSSFGELSSKRLADS